MDLSLTYRFLLGVCKPIRSFPRKNKYASQNLVDLDVYTPGISHMHWHSSVSHAECVYEYEDDDEEEEDDCDDDDDNTNNNNNNNNNNIVRRLIICTPHPILLG